MHALAELRTAKICVTFVEICANRRPHFLII